MKTRILDRLVLVVAGIFVLSGMGMAAEFTADMIQTGQKMLYKGKLYVKGGKLRQEISVGVKQIVIERPDKKLVWTCDPSDKTYMVVTNAIIRGIDDPRARARLKEIGKAKPPTKETINGYLCTKRVWIGKGAPAKSLTEWRSDKLGMNVKILIKETSATRVIEYKNIKLGKVPDSVFEVPKGYHLVPTPSAPVQPAQPQ